MKKPSRPAKARPGTGPFIHQQNIHRDQHNHYYGPAAPLPTYDPRALAGYHRHVVATFDHLTDTSLRFLGSGTGPEGGPQLPRLAEVYVPLDTPCDAASPLETTQPDSARETGALRGDSRPVPAVQRLARHGRLVLLGLPGSGKSTLLRFVSLCLSRHALAPADGWLRRLVADTDTDLGIAARTKRPATTTKARKSVTRSSSPAWPEELSGQVPVFVELRRFANSLAQSPPGDLDRPDCQRLWDFIVEQLGLANLDGAAPMLAAALETGQALVLFDGFDEVPSDSLKTFVSRTVAEFARGRFAPSRFVVTCRTVSYQDDAWKLPDWKAVPLDPLDPPRIQRFIRKFYTELLARRRLDKPIAIQRVDSLGHALDQREELREMAGNPYLLSLMAQLHCRMELPGQRASLFAEFVQELLFAMEVAKRRDDAGPAVAGLRKLIEEAETNDDALRAVLARLAFHAHRSGAQRRAASSKDTSPSVFLPEQALEDALAELPPQVRWPRARRENWARHVLEHVRFRSGLLIDEGGHRFSMAFKLQEFMAAIHVCDPDEFCPQFEAVANLIKNDGGYWDEVVRLAAGYQAHRKGSIPSARSLAESLCAAQAPSPAAAVRRAAIAADILRDIGLNVVQKHSAGRNCLNSVRRHLDSLVARCDLLIRQRSEAASARGWLENLPPGTGLRPDGLPEIDFSITLPAGRFTLAETDEEVGIESPFQLARYPVTVAQYQAFVDAGGYGSPDPAAERPQWWTEEGWDWRNGRADVTEARDWVREAYANERFPILAPANYRPIFQAPTHPRVGVSWFEAEAFCSWLTLQLRTAGTQPPDAQIRLPTEAQWEWAARCDPNTSAADDRCYPWGEATAQDLGLHCNWKETGIGHTSDVTLFPAGQADCGAMDLAGNAWEWCVDWYDDDQDSRVLRGGSWANVSPGDLTCGSRDVVHPMTRNGSLGFRCVWVGESAR